MLVRGLVLVCAAAVVGIVCGRVAISHYALPAVELLVAVPILLALMPRPFAACLLLLVLLCSAPFYSALPRAGVPGHPPINIGDVLLAAMVAATLWRRPWRVWPIPVRRFYLALLLMLALALIPTVALAFHGHTPARDAINGYKDLLYMTVALTVALELSGRMWWPLINAAIVLAVIVSILSVLAAASGSIGHLLTSLDSNAVTPEANPLGLGTTARIRLPGLFLVYAMTIPTLVMVLLVKDRWRTARTVALALMVAAIGVSLNRNMYFGGLAGLVVTLLVGGPRLRYRFLIVAATVAAVVALILESALTPPTVTSQISARAQSALSSQVLSTGSAQSRADEFSHALTSIAHHPWFGVGWFQNYGSYVGSPGLGTAPRAGVEDWYLHLTTDLGIPVALAFLLVVGVVLAFGVSRAARASEPLDRAMIAALVGSVAALLLSCLVGTYLQDPNSMAAFGFACGLLLAAGIRAMPWAGRTLDDRAHSRDLARCA